MRMFGLAGGATSYVVERFRAQTGPCAHYHLFTSCAAEVYEQPAEFVSITTK